MDFVPPDNLKLPLAFQSLNNLISASLEGILESLQIMFLEISYASHFSLGFGKNFRWESCFSKLHLGSLN